MPNLVLREKIVVFLLYQFLVIAHQTFYDISAYGLPAASVPSTGTILVIAKTHINENSVYNTAIGKFTAPADGIYVFHASLHVSGNKKYIYVDINAGGKAIGRFKVGDDDHYRSSSESSGSAVARLRREQKFT